MLNNNFNCLVKKYKKVWYSLDNKLNINLNTYSKLDKIQFEKEVAQIKIKILDLLKTFPQSDIDRKTWSKNFKLNLISSIQDISIDKNKVIKYFMDTGILESTNTFFSMSKNENLSIESLGQAIRNAWIMNILQLIFQRNIECSKSVFAYSMLYPYTDNYIDSNIEYTQKISYSKNFLSRLNGNLVEPLNDYEKNIFKMIKLIESEFNRNDYIEVYESLILIHNSQTNSLIQQNITIPFEKDILDIIFKKGGSSVLADGYLLSGQLTEIEFNFAVSFGILLQLCDDIEDIQNDIDSKNATIFSLAANNKNLNLLANKLLNLVNYCFENDISNFNFDNKENVTNFMYYCCNYLVIAGIISNKKYFNRKYVKYLQQFIPVRMNFIKKFTRNTKKEIDKILNMYDENTKKEMINYINLL
ncbi:hypothetical protein JYG23_05605 [Sedimentibacter sp. zth1]|uniref:hypothetical protein n=1 Tax=Sedimentibacter sp. zth1 TaxID=2816908 RepID=UPI001A9299DF|nr:hypothetical protein [Sedimentibacter sp. zth1]QSX06915.1 hypothetical protein JYG23_05605 [Sedimentibacter sp. zth1]